MSERIDRDVIRLQDPVPLHCLVGSVGGRELKNESFLSFPLFKEQVYELVSGYRSDRW